MSENGRQGWEAVHVDELEAIPVAGVVWRPVRRRLGVTAFGINAYTAEAAGTEVVEDHDESGGGAGGHQEVYVVLRGRATFTVDGASVNAPAGTIVFIREPALRRVAVAEESDTMVLAIGAEPGRAYEVSPWEWAFAAVPLLDEGRFDEAIALLEDGLRERPGNSSLLYNLACAEARSGNPDAAIAHLADAITAQPRYGERARSDPDFESIRELPGFPR